MDHKTLNQCDFCFNLSNPSCSRTASSAPVCIWLYVLVAVVVLVTVCGNLLVIISICCFKHLHTPTNLILLSLAVADLLVGLTVMPFHFFLLMESCWIFGILVCKLFYVCSCCLSCVSMYSVAYIAVDRYFALHDPFLYANKMTVNASVTIVSIIWIYSLTYSLVLHYFNGNLDTNTSNVCFSECAVKITEIWAYVDIICVFFITCSVISILYGKIFAIAKRHINMISKHKSNNNCRSVVSEAKAAINLGIVVVVFLTCSIPYTVTMFVRFTSTDPSMLDVVTNSITPILLNSALNPIMYALFYPWFQKCVKHILTFAFCSSGFSFSRASKIFGH